MKRILTIQDFSCLGKCSITVALPVLAAMGIECAAVPTAVLSAHTFFPNYICRDLTGQLAPTAAHFAQLGIGFDAAYTGYLASPEQAGQVVKMLDTLSHPRLLVDPAMGDDGKLYAGLPCRMPGAMAQLCARAEVIFPNWTEGCLLTGTAYTPEPTDRQVEEVLQRLLRLGAKSVLMTGLVQGSQIRMEGRSAGSRFTVQRPRLVNDRPGTGDLFSSACVGALTLGATLEEAANLAADFVLDAIDITLRSDDPRPYATDFELALPQLRRAAARLRDKQKGNAL